MLKKYSLLFLISLIWGSQFILNKIVLAAIPPLWVAFFRVFLGCGTLIFLLLFLPQKQQKYSWKDVGLFLLIGILESALPLNLILYGQSAISTSMSGILISTVPIWVMVISFLLWPQKTQFMDLISVFLGFLGVSYLLLNEESGEVISFIHAGALLLAACSFASAIMLIDYALQNFPPLLATRNILLGAVFALVLVLPFSEQIPEIEKILEPSILMALLTVGIVCTGLVWLAYTYLIQLSGAAFTSMANYIMPAIGVILGFVFLGEPILLRKIAALGLIILALVLRQIWGTKPKEGGH